jgi:hypothetical protein
MCRGPVAEAGHLLVGRIPRRGPGPGPQRAAGRAAAGVWRVRRRAAGDQPLRQGRADAGRGERAAGGALGVLPGPVPGGNRPAGAAQLRVGQQHQPGPAIGRLGVADPGRGPVGPLLTEAVGVLQIEAVDVRPPEHRPVRRPRAAPPQPEPLRNSAGGPCSATQARQYNAKAPLPRRQWRRIARAERTMKAAPPHSCWPCLSPCSTPFLRPSRRASRFRKLRRWARETKRASNSVAYAARGPEAGGTGRRRVRSTPPPAAGLQDLCRAQQTTASPSLLML